jgi:hypothetical protein
MLIKIKKFLTNTYLYLIPYTLFLLFTFSSISCDQFQNLFLNLPLKTEITASGNGPNIFEVKSFCLSDYDSFNDNIDDVKAIRYVAAAYLTITSSPGLQGTGITATLYRGDGVTALFSVTLPTAVAADYIDNPFEIVLTEAQIDLLNSYLADYKNNDCFVARLTVANVTDNDGPPFSITGQVEIVVELELEF